MQTAIPYMQLRGGSSKGLFFEARDLPDDQALRNRVLIAAMEGVGCGDPRQIDGLGGGYSLTSKVAVISPSKLKDADLEYLFLQVEIGKGKVSTVQTCGNILAGVVPFAIESGMIPAQDGLTTARVNMLNTGGICEILVETPNFKVEYAGNAKVDGVPGTAAPVICNYLEIEGSTCGSLYPTGNIIDEINGIKLTCIDNGMPVVLLVASDFGITGYESNSDLDRNESLKEQLEDIRLKIGPIMNLGDVKSKTIPKMCLISAPQSNGLINTRMFIPHVCHEAIGVLAAISVATACVSQGNVVHRVITAPDSDIKKLSIEHPSGELTVTLDYDCNADGKITIKRSGVMRTVRLLSKGEVFIPDLAFLS
ncbi:4-oxalomesaconate tautomerase [Mucilaginibacter flavidus]|uniref:4-oxalomesaconate tautomerase n=1 Tax=Mucilaginibacter flavidus TaxID=2949309 RepID=UPI002092B83C|nr:4-oxalomesaconate tautomerase [Mucilaginibacter flavidus]MCO5949360.1 4-oxalomesaconate tautomerase [Mucilaginibacter flavidus]